MKRSEAIQKLLHRLDQIKGASIDGEPEVLYPSDLYIVESLLDEMENLGMLPPPNIGVYDNVPTVTPTGNYDYGYERKWTEE